MVYCVLTVGGGWLGALMNSEDQRQIQQRGWQIAKIFVTLDDPVPILAVALGHLLAADAVSLEQLERAIWRAQEIMETTAQKCWHR